MPISIARARRPVTVSAALLPLAATLIINPVAVGPAAADPAACTPYKIVAVPGTTETNSNANTSQPVGLLKGITDIIGDRADISYEFVAYTAEAFTGSPYAVSQADGVNKTESILSGTSIRCPAQRVFLVGYSQGADVAGDIAAKIGSGGGPIPADRLAGTVLISDPQRGTPGESIVGPNPPGDGIAGPRPGFNGAPVATICGDVPSPDLYCATPEDQQLLHGIGQVLSTTTLDDGSGSSTLPSDPADQALSQGLTSFNIDGISTGVKKLTDAASSGDRTGMQTAAADLQSKTPGLQAVSDSIGKSPAVTTLDAFPAGTQQQQTASVLGNVKSVEIAGLSNLLNMLATAGDAIGVDQLTGAATSVAQTVAPLTGIGSSDITTASRVVQGIQPLSVLRNAAVVTDKVSRVDFIGIFNDLKALFDLAVVGRFGDLPNVINGLNLKLVGIVEAVDAVDLSPLITVLGMIPEPNAQIAAMVLKVVNSLDMTKLAMDVADIVKYVMAGQLLAVPPLVLDLFTTGLQSSGLLNGVDLSAVTKLAENFNPETVMSAATQAVSFYSGGSHTNYPNLVVDDRGRNPLQWAADWFMSLARG